MRPATATVQASPANPIQQPIGWRRGRNGSQRSQHDHPAVHERDTLFRKPGDDGLQPGHQRAGSAESNHGARHQKLWKARRRTEQRGAAGRDDQQHALDSTRPKPIQKYPYWDLGQPEDQEIDRGEQPGLCGANREVGSQCRRYRSIDRPKEVGKVVTRGKRQKDREDQAPF